MVDNKKVLMGTLGATLAGVAVGVLLAPKKGTETRKMIKEKANDLGATAKQTFEDNYAKGREVVNDLTEKVKTQFNSGSDGSNTSRKGDGLLEDESYSANAGTGMAGASTSGNKYGAGSSATRSTSGTTPGSTSTNLGTSSTTTPGSTSTTPGSKTTGTDDKFNSGDKFKSGNDKFNSGNTDSNDKFNKGV